LTVKVNANEPKLVLYNTLDCTNNQVEYESLLHGLDYLRDLGARDVDVFRESNLIVQQIRGLANT
jgi:ribonuclease HI